jgi:hypothetical protein
MKYDVYQINFTSEQVREINNLGGTPDYHRYLRATCFPKVADVLAAKDLYKKAAVIEADSLEGVFHLGNVGPPEAVDRLGPFHSVSVGDVVVDPEGKAWVVASCGFDEVEGWL